MVPEKSAEKQDLCESAQEQIAHTRCFFMKTFKLHLIRHGLTSGNLQGLYIGSGTDIPLCDEGRAQLAELKDATCRRSDTSSKISLFICSVIRMWD